MSHEDKVKKGAESIEGTSGPIGASGVDGAKVKKDIESIAGTLCPEGALGASGKDDIEEVEEYKMSRDEIEAITLLYDNISYDERIRTPKPKGYRQPDMDFPRKGRKPRNRKQNYERRKK